MQEGERWAEGEHCCRDGELCWGDGGGGEQGLEVVIVLWPSIHLSPCTSASAALRHMARQTAVQTGVRTHCMQPASHKQTRFSSRANPIVCTHSRPPSLLSHTHRSCSISSWAPSQTCTSMLAAPSLGHRRQLHRSQTGPAAPRWRAERNHSADKSKRWHAHRGLVNKKERGFRRQEDKSCILDQERCCVSGGLSALSYRH